MKNVVNVGLIGFGTVGAGVAKIMLGDKKPHLRGRNFELNLVKIADLDITTDRGVAVPDGVLTTNVSDILKDPDIGVVIELIGGYEPAKAFTLAAFKAGKSVITANKALVAKHGDELFQAAADAGVSYYFEAAVGGGIPIIRGITHSLNANVIERIYGILNGTTNYILTGMERDGSDYSEVLAKAQQLGYAEADPAADVAGYDARNKVTILAKLAFGASIDVDDVYCEGIENITLEDIESADSLGYTIKLLAIAKRHADGNVEVRVHPTLVANESIMAYVQDEFNAIEIYGDAVGREIFYGKGAGMMPTGSAVVSDTVSAASGIINKEPPNVKRILVTGENPPLIDMAKLRMRYYLNFSVKDEPGVLAQITLIFTKWNISIESVIQKGKSAINHVPLIIMTHEACEGDMQQAMAEFRKMDSIEDDVKLIRVGEV